MKRRREIEKKRSEIRRVIEEVVSMLAVAKVNDQDNSLDDIPTKPFLFLSSFVIQVLDKIGPTMAVLRQDVAENIKRLEKFQETDTVLYSNMVEILKKEAKEGVARKAQSCSKSVLWLTRALDFMVALLESLLKDFDGTNMEQAVEEAYKLTLKPWHGWISSAACRVALKMVPDNKTLLGTLMDSKDEDYDMLKKDLKAFVSLLVPLLEQIHTVLNSYGLDKLKST